MSTQIRPAKVEDRLIPGRWEDDLIKGAGNRTSVGTLAERRSGSDDNPDRVKNHSAAAAPPLASQ